MAAGRIAPIFFSEKKDENVQRKYLESKYCKVARDVWAE